MYTLKKLKTWNTDGGGGFQVILIRDGKTIAEVTNDGQGGSYRWSWKDTTPCTVNGLNYLDEPITYSGFREEAKLWEVCKALPKVESFGSTMAVNPEMYVEELVNELLLERYTKRMLKSVIVVNGSEVYKFQSLLTPAFRNHVLAKWPNGKILNDLPFTDAVAIIRTIQNAS